MQARHRWIGGNGGPTDAWMGWSWIEDALARRWRARRKRHKYRPVVENKRSSLHTIFLNSAAPKPLNSHVRKNIPSIHQVLYASPFPMDAHPSYNHDISLYKTKAMVKHQHASTTSRDITQYT
jgi:hypothetical protein